MTYQWSQFSSTTKILEKIHMSTDAHLDFTSRNTLESSPGTAQISWYTMSPFKPFVVFNIGCGCGTHQSDGLDRLGRLPVATAEVQNARMSAFLQNTLFSPVAPFTVGYPSETQVNPAHSQSQVPHSSCGECNHPPQFSNEVKTRKWLHYRKPFEYRKTP